MCLFVKRSLLAGVIALASFSSQAYGTASGNFYANAHKFELDPKLPEPFSRTQAVQVVVSHEHQDVSLVFLMSDSEGIDVTFPMISEQVDQCRVREIIAAPPAGSTPYYKDFEIRVKDYSESTCDKTAVGAETLATLKSYEVRHQSTTFSKIYAEALKPVPSEKN